MKRLFFVFWLVLVSSVAFGQVDKIVGYWVSVDDNTGKSESVFCIYKGSDGKYYGKVSEILLPEYREATCDKCPGEDRGRKVMGMVMLKGLKADGDKLIGGRITDPRTGKTYSCRVSYDAKTDRLKLRGSLDKMGVLGRTQYWIRKK